MPNPTVRLRVGGARGHLHFFRKMVHTPEIPIDPGALVDVLDRDGSFVGRGFYNPRSNITVRLLTTDASQGSAEEFIRARLRDAVALRHDLLKLPSVSDAYRVCHSEGDGLSGLVVDRYGPVLSIEIFSRGFLKLLDRVKAWLLELYPGSAFCVRADDTAAKLEGFNPPPAETPEGVIIREHGIGFRVDFERGHKTGFFCDQRDNRAAAGRMAAGRNVLDLCTYSGGFALSTAKGGAQRVVGVDMDEKALEVARQNARLNKVKVDFLHADLFNYLRQSKEKFGLIVLDPPKLARDEEDLPKARRTYHDMNAMAMKAAEPGGLLMSCSCSGRVSEE
ncbi:MAG TPA: class I SAM-dependent rRNA methyltransferase, partial [Planctomycetota bacterium]|nr:class I SAM-dependent rRNA methyltransferase [Planctomycetota bacterium]